ncbi:protein disulfide isomerase-like 1-4 [Typha latifolia]|uniref:protein disulfide isomerase-like 1-4 n=1 Tax=Typha latifolia TaxID=4733 RepID=UPI003C2CA5F2
MAPRFVLLAFAFSALFLLHGFTNAAVELDNDADEEEELLNFLEDGSDSDSDMDSSQEFPSSDEVSLSDASDGEDFDPDEYEDVAGQMHENSADPIDESDVVVLKEGNFSEFLASHRHVMVEFYAPWCMHCQALAPEYAAAATALRDEDVALAKVDATEENELAQKYEVQGFPSVAFFVDGVRRDYPGQRTKDAIVTWIKKKIGPGIHNITTVEEAEKILTAEDKVVLGFLDSLVGADSNELADASKLEDEVNFYQTASPDVAKLFHIDPLAKRPSLVLLKKDVEKLAYFDGEFTKSTIADFVFANKLPLVSIFTRENAPAIFDNPIKKQILLFAVSNDTKELMPTFQEAAKLFKGKLIFIYVEKDNEDVGVPVSDYFGVTGDDPKVLAYSGNEDARKYMLEGELSLDNIKTFAEGFLEDKLKIFYKSDPIPETNDGDVKIVVGNNFDDIVLDESKDVLLELYAPWCGHCQALEPIYNKLAKHLRGIDSLVIAKMDGTKNEHPRAKADGFPTLLFYPAGNKSFDPITVETDRTVVAFYKFIKQHASIPFKLQRPASATKAESASEAPAAEAPSLKISTADMKDEL